jgi:membrane-bound serine protease (ClpP class)
MLLHPLILIPKLIIIVILVILLIWLHGELTTGQWWVAVLISLVFLGLFFIFMMWLLSRMAARPGSRVGKGFVLDGQSDSSKGFVAADSGKRSLIGQTGITISMLRPAGKVDIQGERIDAVSDGEFIPKDAKVEVVKFEGNRVVVKPVG